MLRRLGAIPASLVCISSFASVPQSPALCYVSSSNRGIHMPSLRSDYLFHGHEMAMKDYLHKQPSKVVLKRLTTDGSDTSLLNAVKNAKQNQCVATIGYFTSREALLSIPQLKANDLFGVSISASHTQVQEGFPYLMTGVAPSEEYIEAVLKKVVRLGTQKVFVLNSKDDIYSNHYTDRLKAALGERAEVLSFESGDGLVATQIAQLDRKGSRVIVFTTYPMPSLAILSEMASSKGDYSHATIVGSPSWAFDLATFRPRPEIFRKDANYLIPDSWDRKSGVALQFRKRFKETYGAIPEADAAYSYDLTQSLLGCLDRSNGHTPVELSGCLISGQWSGVVGSWKFKAGSSFAQRPVAFSDPRALIREKF